MINELGWKIKTQNDKINVITGAGISMNSGLPSGSELNNILLNYLSDSWLPNECSTAIADSIPLETIFQVFADFNLEKIIDKVIKQLDSDNISSAHKALNNFSKSGMLENLITFNFDCIHEKSFSNSKVINKKMYGKTVINVFENNNGRKFNLIKLHGSCEQKGIITFSEYITGFPKEIHLMLQDIFNESFFLVLGYGGWDYDFTQALKSSVLNNNIPKELIWIDWKFPKSGGRTELINLLRDYGCIVHAIEMDFEDYFNNQYKPTINSNTKLDFNELSRDIECIKIKTKKEILLQLSFQQSEIDITKQVIKSTLTKRNKQYDFSYYEGLYYERIGKTNEAIQFFSDSIGRNDNIAQNILASHKIFRLSDGAIRKFISLTNKSIPTTLIEYVNFLEYCIITDKDGLDRNYALNLSVSLPPIETLLNENNSTDWIKILIKIHAELARINYENKFFQEAFAYDINSLELARILSDPEYIKSTTGNVGVAYMGLAYETKTHNEEIANWKKAKRYLSESLVYPKNFSQFHHALFQGNLGISEYYLGNKKKAIDLISKSKDSLLEIYPNYSIYFIGKLSYILAKEKDKDSINNAMNQIIEGVHIMKRLVEFDDIEQIAIGIKEISVSDYNLTNEDYKKAKQFVEKKILENKSQP